MNIKDRIKIDEPNFKGISVNDAVPLETIIELGVTMAWTLDPIHIKYFEKEKFPQILIAGNDKRNHPCYSPPYCPRGLIGCHQRFMEKGKYFIANITDIKYCKDYIIATKGWADINFRKHHCFKNYPITTPPFWPEKKKRYAIYFDNIQKIEILDFDNTNFKFLQNPIQYLGN